MRNLLRRPLPWMILSECAIVGVLAMVAWHMVASPPVQQIQRAGVAAPTAPAREPVVSAPKTVAGEATAPKPLLPGLNMDSSFWKRWLAELNRSESSFEQVEWRIVHAAMDAARRYVKAVVLPAIVRAERGAG